MLDSVYTTESDVWSYGILTWEVVTLGKIANPDVIPSCPVPEVCSAKFDSDVQKN